MFNSQTPTHKIETDFVSRFGVSLYIKRDDLIHPFISGNKWFKLKYNVETFLNSNDDTIVTFGGAFSNHLIATAAMCAQSNIPCVGIVRGDELSAKSNFVLRICQEFGMTLKFVSRADYKDPQSVIEKLNLKKVFVIPEGGDNADGIKGCKEIIEDYTAYDHIVVPIGTGTTFCGIINGSQDQSHIHGICAVGDGTSLKPKISSAANYKNWTLHTAYSYGGFGKYDKTQASFNKMFTQETGILLDPVYTGKMMRGVYDLIQNGVFRATEKVLCIHTGGLTGLLSDHWLKS